MKKFILSLICVAFAISAFAQEKHITVKGIELDGTLSTVLAKFKEAGLTKAGTDFALPTYKGSFAGFNECIFIFATPEDESYVYKVAILTPSRKSWSSVLSDFNTLKESYKAKYENIKVYEFFESPYEEGDGFELQALKADKCTYAFLVKTDEGDILVQMKSVSTGTAYLSITYEDKINMQKYLASKAQTISNDI
jgi:hypothetical protein